MSEREEILRREAHAFLERKTQPATRARPAIGPSENAKAATERSGFGKGRTFAARCEPPEMQHELIASAGLSVFIGQSVRRNGREEIWDSVVARCDELADGTLRVRVFISDPSWDELLQIAEVSSKPSDPENHAILGCNLDHISRPRTS